MQTYQSAAVSLSIRLRFNCACERGAVVCSTTIGALVLLLGEETIDALADVFEKRAPALPKASAAADEPVEVFAKEQVKGSAKLTSIHLGGLIERRWPLLSFPPIELRTGVKLVTGERTDSELGELVANVFAPAEVSPAKAKEPAGGLAALEQATA